MKTRHISLIVLLASLLAIIASGQLARAADTDIYLKAQSVARDDSPNVLIIFDTSGSMDTTVTSRPAYDPTVDYCASDLDTLTGIAGANAGKPESCAAITGRIYFSFSGSPPDMSSSRWFASTKNNCFDSASSFSSAGLYGGAKVARWRSGSNWRSLNGENDSDITYVDCEADGSANGQLLGDNTFPWGNNSNAYTNKSNQAFNWSNFTSSASPTLYTSNYMNYHHNSALKKDQPRLDIAKESVKSIIDGNKNVRFGLMIFNRNSSSDSTNTGNHGGRLIFKIDNMTDQRRTDMKGLVDGLQADGFTPLAETMWEAYRYFGGHPVDYGDNDPTAAPTVPPGPSNRDESAESAGNYISPFGFQCQKAYVILVTDGDPTNDANANSNIQALAGIGTCDGSSCLDDLAGWGRNNDTYSGLTGDQKIATYTISFSTGITPEGQALLQQTATKGGGAYFTALDADQLSAALQGALAQILERNTSFTSPSLSVNAFNRLHNRDEVYFALFKPSDTTAWDGNVKKYRLCTNADIAAGLCDDLSDILDQTPQNIIDNNAKIIDTAWSHWTSASSNPDGSDVTKGGAGENVPVQSLRKVYTYNGSYVGLSASTPASPVEIKIETPNNAFYDAVTANPTILGLPTGATAADVDTLINWIRGQDSYDKDVDGLTTDMRWSLGDPLHSRPVAITYGAVTVGTEPDFNNPIIKLFVGTNDGTIHMINNSTGVEEWAFMPKEMYGVQYRLAQDADGEHVYGLDNTPSFWIKDFNGDGIIDPAAGDRAYMYIAMRRGGRNIYAFDVTPAVKMDSHDDTTVPKLMWVIEGGVNPNFAQLGQTWSRPLVTRIRFKCPTTGSVCDDGNPDTDDSEARVALLFAGGYDVNQDNNIPAGPDSLGNAIYIVDPLTGARIWWASSDTTATLVLPKMKYSIPSDLALMDSDGDGTTDRLYVGDTGGQLWRIDLGDQMQTNSNGGTFGYVFADVGCAAPGTRSDDCAATAVQDRRKFFYPPDVAQVKDTVFSDKAEYDLVAIGSGDREDPLDLLTSALITGSKEAVHSRIYAFRDYHYKTGRPVDNLGNNITPAPLTEANMYNATANLLSTETGVALQDEINTLKTSSGWFIDLKESSAITVPNGTTTVWVGEKVLARTAIFNGVLFVTTFTPANDTVAVTTCSANEGVARQFALNAFTAVGEGDFNTDNVKERFGQIGGGIPSEVVIVFRPDGTSGLIGTSGGAAKATGDFTDMAQRTYWHEGELLP